jgi:hypothetical protein
VTYDPASEDLLEALTVLARYVAVIEQPGDRAQPVRSAQAGSATWLPLTPVQPAAGPQLRAGGPAHTAPARLGAAGGPAAQACSLSCLLLFISPAPPFFILSLG